LLLSRTHFRFLWFNKGKRYLGLKKICKFEIGLLTKNCKLFSGRVTHKYIYNSNIDTIISDPYLPNYVLDGMYRQLSSESKKYDKDGKILEIEIKFYSGELKFLNIEYEYNFGLLKTATVHTDEGLFRHDIHYDFYQKYKH
jgi:hypothetical protein